MAIKLLIADPQKITRDGLRTILESDPDIHVVGMCDTWEKLAKIYARTTPDVLLISSTMPDMDILDILKNLCNGSHKRKPVRAVVLSSGKSDELAIRLLKAGATAFVPKSTSGAELTDIIRNAPRGETYVPDDMRESVLTGVFRDPVNRAEMLTSREFQVYTAYANGISRAEIARKLKISIRTIDTHRKNIMKKLGFKNTVELVKAAIKEGIV